MILTTAKRFQLTIPEEMEQKSRWRCAMKLDARWYGEWSNGKDDYRWQPLEWAGTELEIRGSGHHRAIDDTLNVFSVLRGITEQAGKYLPPVEMPYVDRYYGD